MLNFLFDFAFLLLLKIVLNFFESNLLSWPLFLLIFISFLEFLIEKGLFSSLLKKLLLILFLFLDNLNIFIWLLLLLFFKVINSFNFNKSFSFFDEFLNSKPLKFVLFLWFNSLLNFKKFWCILFLEYFLFDIFKLFFELSFLLPLMLFIILLSSDKSSFDILSILLCFLFKIILFFSNSEIFLDNFIANFLLLLFICWIISVVVFSMSFMILILSSLILL